MALHASGDNARELFAGRLCAFLNGHDSSPRLDPPASPLLIGVLEGSGIGPTVIGAALQVLAAVEEAMDLRFEVRRGGPIGEEAEALYGRPLPESTAKFCAEIFGARGAILNGPGGSRYVYDLRRQFDLFCKFVPVRPRPELAGAGKLAPQHLQAVDLLIVRDNVGGVYQGQWRERNAAGGRMAEHSFGYSEAEVQRLISVAARAAASRRGRLHVIIKDGGVPAISALWRDIGRSMTRRLGVESVFMNVDLAAYELIQRPEQFDVIVAPNLFGDILADITGVLLGSRGVTFSGNFDSHGNAVYQTNHGCAHDLAGTDKANPAGQILSLAMLLRESFGLDEAANLVERSLAQVWREGWRTEDLPEPGCRVLGTRAMTERVVQQVHRLAERNRVHETRAAVG
jgi:3-isopropylmalate dehydrogenase